MEIGIIGGISLALIIAAIADSIIITKQEHVRIIEQFGRFYRVAKPGMSFKLPWPIQAARENFTTQILQISEDISAKSQDNAFVIVPVNAQIRVDPDTANLAYYKLRNPEEQIRSYIKNRVRSKASQMSFEQLFQSQTDFQEDIMDALSERMAEFGFVIENVLVDDPQPSPSLVQAFDRVLASKRLLEAAQNEGEAVKVKAIAKAQAEGESLEIKAKAFAQWRQITSDGNSAALEAFCQGTGLSSQDALAFFIATNEMEAVRDAASEGGNVTFVAAAAAGEARQAALLGMVSPQGMEKPPVKSLPDSRA